MLNYSFWRKFRESGGEKPALTLKFSSGGFSLEGDSGPSPHSRFWGEILLSGGEKPALALTQDSLWRRGDSL
jgi:hypothetical protein